MSKGIHLIVDCRDVPRSTCLDEEGMMVAIGDVLQEHNCTILNRFGQRLGKNSPPGFAITFTLDESHVTAHSYADEQKLAIDIFTCGTVHPQVILSALKKKVRLGKLETREVERFI